MGKVWTAKVRLTPRLPVGSQGLWPWIPCWNFIFPLHSWALGLYLIPHLCNRECCLSMCSKIIAKFRGKKKKQKKNDDLVWTYMNSGARWWVGDLCSILRTGRRTWWVCCQQNIAWLWISAPSLTRFSSYAEGKLRCYLQSPFHHPWLRGDFAVVLMKLQLPETSYAAAFSKALEGT